MSIVTKTSVMIRRAVRSAGFVLCVPLFAALAVPDAAAQTVFPREVLTPQVPGARAPDGGPALVPGQEPVTVVPEGGPAIQLTGVAVEGATVFGDADFAGAVAPFLVRPITFGELRLLTRAIEQVYTDAGYIAVRAIVPPQDVTDGRLRVRVIEGAIGEVRIEGDLGRARPQVEALLGGLVGRSPLKADEAERQLLLARDLPGVSLVAALRAAPEEAGPGALVLLVDASLDRADGFASVTNFASDIAGPWVGTVGGGGNSVLISGDRAEAVFLTAFEFGEQYLGQLTYEAPLPVDGLRARALFSSSLSEAGDILAPFDIDYRSYIGTVELEYAALRSRERSAWVALGMDFIHQDANADLPVLEIDEDLRVLFLNARYVESDLGGGRFDAAGALRVGLPILGASDGDNPGASRPGADAEFVSFQTDMTYDRWLTRDVSVAARVRSQVSSGDLSSYEVFSLGNYTLGRGFDPGTVTGDHGVAGGIELRYSPEIPAVASYAAPELFGFLESGVAFSDGSDRSLTSAGIGIRALILDRVSAEAIVAFPLDAPDFVDDDPTALFRVVAFF